MIYNINGYIKSSAQNLEKEPVERSNEFLWISRAIFIITRYNKNYKKEEDDFHIFFDECSNSIRDSLKRLFTKTFNKCKGIEEYSLNSFIQDFNVILSKCDLNQIEIKTIVNDTQKKIDEKNINSKIETTNFTKRKKIKFLRPMANNQINQSLPICQIIYPNNLFIPIQRYPIPYIQSNPTEQFVEQFRASLENLNKFINIQTENINQFFNQTQNEYNALLSSIRNNNN